jgi:hypothetical protein
MNKKVLLGCLAVLAMAGSGYAATREFWVDTYGCSGDSFRYAEYREGARIITPCCWQWPKAEKGSYVLMKYETGVKLAKNWSFQYDCKSANPWDVKAWAHVKDRGFGSIKCDSNMKSSISCNVTEKWRNNPSWCINMQVNGGQDKSGKWDYSDKYWTFDLMIRPNYSGSHTHWPKVWIDGVQWYKMPPRWEEKNAKGETIKRVTMVFERVNKTYNTSIKVKPFMESCGLSNWYVGALDFGWEVYTGTARWEVNSMGIWPW